MGMEFSEIVSREGELQEWAESVHYGGKQNQEQTEISEVMDAWAKKLGKTGRDEHGELSALVLKSLTTEEVTAPSELMDALFDWGHVDEFDDQRFIVEPKNTMVAHEVHGVGGDVDASYIEHRVVTPKWTNLQASTYITMQDLRQNGYRSVAKMIANAKAAFEIKKVEMLLKDVDELILNTSANYIAEGGAMPTVASADALALYLQDVTEGGVPLAFSQNKYMQVISKLEQAERWTVEADRNIYNQTGFLTMYGGMKLLGFSGQKKLVDGSFVVPDKRIFGIAGKIGCASMRGEVRVLEEVNVHDETVFVKVSGFTFGYAISDLTKVAKIVMGV